MTSDLERVEPEPIESVPAILARRAREDSASILIEDVSGESITVGEFHRRSLMVASALRSLGVERGDCVATVLDPCIDAHLCWIGACWAGAMEVPVNPELQGDLLAYAVGDCKAATVVTTAKYLPGIRALADRLPHLKRFVLIDEDAGEPDAVSLWRIAEEASPIDPSVPEISDPYCVIYTSGTTGAPKGVVVPWGSLQYAAQTRLFSGDRISDYADPAFYCPWPMFHSSGRTGMAFAVVYGGRFVIRQRLSTSAFWDDVRRYRCTHAHLLGLADYLLVQAERPDDADNPLRRVLMNPVIRDYRAFERRFGVVVSTGWGQTEVGFPVADADLPNAQTCGKLSPLYDMRLVDDSGQDVAPGSVGAALIRAHRPWLMLSDYLGRPDALAKAWRDGWFHTGDMLRQDEAGYYYFVDRMADCIRVRGNNVSSLELEQQALKHPNVREAAAIGIVTDAQTEDEIRLVVRLEDGATIVEAELWAFLNDRVPRYMVPRFIEFVADYPRTPTGKVRKAELRKASFVAWDRQAHH